MVRRLFVHLFPALLFTLSLSDVDSKPVIDKKVALEQLRIFVSETDSLKSLLDDDGWAVRDTVFRRLTSMVDDRTLLEDERKEFIALLKSYLRIRIDVVERRLNWLLGRRDV